MEALARMRDNNVTIEDIKAGVAVLQAKGYRITSPASIENAVNTIVAERKQRQEQAGGIKAGEGWQYV